MKQAQQRAKLDARKTGPATPRKHTKAESLANQIGAPQDNIGDLDFCSFSREDRELVMAALTSLTNTLNEAFDRLAQ